MLTSQNQEAYIKNFKTIKPGSFKSESGEEIAYDGYQQVTLSMFNKNGELVDIRFRIPNSKEGEAIYVGLKTLPLMTKIFIDVEIQVSASGSTKFFITSFAKA